MNRQKYPSNIVGFALSCAMSCSIVAAMVTALVATMVAAMVATTVVPAFVGVARADVRVDFHESSWSVRSQPPEQSSVLRSWVSGGKRRVENEILPDPVTARDPKAPPPVYFAQIDRIDLDSSFVVLPRDSLYGSVPFERSRAMNHAMLQNLVAARTAGMAPADTLPPVRVTELPKRARKFFGVPCRAFELELKFEYRDSIPGSPGLRTTGVLTDTVWIAPPESPLGEMQAFERDFAHATFADSFLTGANAVELSQSRGQGLIAVLRRQGRKLPGYIVASHFRNVIYGLPKGMGGVERSPDGAVVVQRSVRVPTILETTAIEPSVFEVPSWYRRDVPGEK